MNTDELFDEILNNLKVGDRVSKIRARRDEITKVLNRDFRNIEDGSKYRLMVGSFGRHTAIKGISDLDMVFILPPKIWSEYSGPTGPKRILERVSRDLKDRYPKTDIQVDQCVVRVQFVTEAFKFEIQPVFENEDRSFSYPDTYSETWKKTRPREETQAIYDRNEKTQGNMRDLARMARAWKNANGVVMGGLLIDTLVYNFLTDRDCYVKSMYDEMVCDFFEFLGDEDEKAYYLAPGSNQQVTVRQPFQAKARRAEKGCRTAIEKEETQAALREWRSVFGTCVPIVESGDSRGFDDTEQYIESFHPVRIGETVSIDCRVQQDGFRVFSLRELLKTGNPLLPRKSLTFHVVECSAKQPYAIKWKVLNRGGEARRRNMIRGQIITSSEKDVHREHTVFQGEHLVECYVVKDGVVVARDRIDVPITKL